jgi:nuclease HARBI1
MTPHGLPYYVYGDQGYPLLPNLIVQFRGRNLTDAQKKCNKRMSAVRESVEWGFAKVIQLFGFLDFKKNLKIGLQPVGQYYIVGAILTNCHSCLYGNQTSTYFDCQPPELDDYVNN